MSSRGKQILRLVLKNESEKREDPKDKKEYDFSEQEEDDPWFYFHQWQENRKNKAKPVENFENRVEPLVSEDLSNLNNIPGNEGCSNTIISESSELDVTNSSESWKKPDKVGDNGSITDTSKQTSWSEIIPKIKPIICKQFINRKSVELVATPIDENVQVKGRKETTDLSANGVTMEEKNNCTGRAHERKKTAEIKIANNILVRPAVEVSRRRGRVWDRKDRCPYCNEDVTNFSRHLFRKHPKEESVYKILEYPKGSILRKKSIELLRKQGNFSVYSEQIVRPVQRPTSSTTTKNTLPDDFLPCKYCKGLYKKCSLGRHAKKCFFNNGKDSAIRYASEGQTLLAFQGSRKPFLDRLRLKTEVFDNMHPDKISFNGKSDIIVCQYAEDYLRKHKRPHIKNLVSNKIRELGRLLIPLQEVYNINSMLEALKPQNFEKVVAAARIITVYNEATKSFQALSLALHLRTILLAVCSSAKTLLLKKDPVLPVTNYDEVMKDIKNFRELVHSNWKFEMGSLALKDLNEKHSNKSQTLPLTQDIILFKDYCFKIAGEAIENLRKSLENIDSFQRLSEATLALTVLINRKRVGDVQYMKLESYNQSLITNHREECLNILTEAEKELTKYFKRVTTVGKGSKPVAILFPKKIQEFVNMILAVRNTTNIVPKENPFLFALARNSSRWIDGSSTLRKYAVSCGAKNPETLTSSRLRKQIATVLQILNLSEVEMEQVASFMGHTKKTHEEFYRLPQEVFQTSKVAKLLLMVERGIRKEDQGKSLDEIDVQLKHWENDEQHKETREETDDMILNESGNGGNTNNMAENVSLPSTSRDVKHPQEKIKCRGSWTQKQKNIMLLFFKSNIKNRITPRKSECLKLKEKHLQLFKEKSWEQIKIFVYNSYRKPL